MDCTCVSMVIRLILIFEFQLPNSNPSKKEVECKVKLSYHERDIQKIGEINYLTRLNIVCFPKQINVSYQIQLSYRSTNHVF